jgi:hypothetical protein
MLEIGSWRQLQMAGSGEQKSTAKIQNVKCMGVGDTIVRNVGSEHADMECFPGIKAEKLHSDGKEGARLCRDANYTCGYNLGTTRNLDFIMGEVYTLVAAAKKLPKSKLVLCGVLRRRDVSWRRIGGLNVTLACVARAV